MKYFLIASLLISYNLSATKEITTLNESKTTKKSGTFDEFKESYNLLFDQELADEWLQQEDKCKSSCGKSCSGSCSGSCSH